MVFELPAIETADIVKAVGNVATAVAGGDEDINDLAAPTSEPRA